MVYQVTSEEDFDQRVTQAPGLVVVDFFAEWCGPCKKIAPFLDELSEIYNTVTFMKVDVDELDELTGRYDIRAMPTFVFLKQGQEVDRLKGAKIEALTEKITELVTPEPEVAEEAPEEVPVEAPTTQE